MSEVTSSPLLARLLWSSDAATQNAIMMVLGVAILAALFVYGPVILRLVRIVMLDRAVRSACRADERPGEDHRDEMATAFQSSPVASQFEEFFYRWTSAQTDGPQERSPVRLIEILDERPLLPNGPVRSLLPAMPGLFLAVGIAGTFFGLTAAVSEGTLASEALGRSELVSALGAKVGLALRSSLWGLLLAIGSIATGRILEGSYDRYSESLDQWVERLFGSVSEGELSNLMARSQRQTLEQLGTELTRFTIDLTERLDRGLQRIEISMSNAAGLVSEEQRGVLASVVRELSLQVQQGVEQHLGALHDMLDEAVTHQGAVTGGITEAFEQMAEHGRSQAHVTQVLEQAAGSVQTAAASFSRTADDFDPVLDSLRHAGTSLQQTASAMESTQRVVARSASGIQSSLEHAAAAMNEQRDFIESGLGEIRSTLDSMSSGLGENLNRALRNVDDSLEHTVGRLRETITDSNETIDRMTLPVRAAEGAARELHTALERVRSEITGLGDWLGQSIKPLRATLAHLEDKTSDITRALIEFGDHSHKVDKTMDALRGEIHEEGRKFRAASQELGRTLIVSADAARALEKTTAETDRRWAATGAPALEADLDFIETPAPAPARTLPSPAPQRAPSRPTVAASRFAAERTTGPLDSEIPPPRSEPRTAPPPRLDPAPPTAPPDELAPPNVETALADEPATPPPDAEPAPEAETPAPAAGILPAAGRSLGPDPFTRLGIDREEAHGPESPASVTSPGQPRPPGPGSSQPARFAGSDDLSLSGLLGKRKAGEGASGSESQVDYGSRTGSDTGAGADDQPNEDSAEPPAEATSSKGARRTRRSRRRG